VARYFIAFGWASPGRGHVEILSYLRLILGGVRSKLGDPSISYIYVVVTYMQAY
jgi:hypothetical protein